MTSNTSSTPTRRTARSVERRARRRPSIVAGSIAAGVLTVVGFAGATPVSYAEAGGTTPTFALASYATSVASPAAEKAVAEAAPDAAHEVLDAAETTVDAAAAVTADVAESGLELGVKKTSIDTSKLEDAADRLEIGIGHLPEPVLADVADDVSELADSIDEQVASLRGSLDAAIAAEEERKAEEKARQEAEARAAAEAEAAAQAAASSSGSSSAPAASYPSAPIPSGNGNGDNSPAGAQAFAYSQFASRGWGDDQFGCLVALWNKESGWNYQAYNAGSGAYGIPQALPGSKMGSAGADWQSNAATQVLWGLGYIQGRYGTPCNAWGHSQSTGWY
ncbi:lytic transglycosylase domain-containing protein [Microbacterium sp. NPDC019599]|uniref:aggregation-promoting factor C-terminal-like domain-containing protein n=1 Tax=Microbacterium sp. NPDC019599 TaxID=3154690 RepID=UPI0033FA72A9